MCLSVVISTECVVAKLEQTLLLTLLTAIQEVVHKYEKSIGTKMNDRDIRITVLSTIASYSPSNISETVRDRDLVPKDHQ